MIAQSSRSSRWLQEYVTYLVRLHRLISKELGDSEEADALRDQMDPPWKKLTEDEIRLIDGLSADLYRLHEPPIENVTKDQAVIGPILAALREEAWVRALDLVRHHEQQIPSAVSSFWRGLSCAGLGLFSAASEFFGHAAGLYSPEALFWTLWMDSLMSDHQEAKALDVANRAITQSSAPEVLLKAASMMFLNAETQAGVAADQLHRRAIETSEKGLAVLAANPAKSSELEREIVLAHLHKAMSLARLGDLSGARDACETALTLSPNSLDAFMVLGFLDEAHERGDEARVNIVRELVQPIEGPRNQLIEAVPF